MRCATLDLMKAAYGRYALGAFNVSNLEQVHGLFRGAAEAAAPVIVQFTRVMRGYANPRMLEAMLQAAETIYPQVTFAVHLDHGDEACCEEAIESGHYGSVMIDASSLPFEQNVAATRRVVDKAHNRGIGVEAELGLLKGIEDDASHRSATAILTDPDQAAEFVRQTGCDSLAVAVGTSHGAYKFSGAQRLHFDRLAAIQQRVGRVPLVLHGASAVPQAEVLRINAAGGALDPAASGVAAEEIVRAVSLGVTKVNIGTDGRLLWTRVHREFFRDRPGEFDFMIPGRIYMEAFAAFVAAKCKVLGSSGAAPN